MRRVADGGVREVGRRRRGQDSRGRELQRRVWRGAPRRYNCKTRRQRSGESMSLWLCLGREWSQMLKKRVSIWNSPLCPTLVRPGWWGWGKVLSRGEESCGEVGLNSGFSGFFIVGEDMSAGREGHTNTWMNLHSENVSEPFWLLLKSSKVELLSGYSHGTQVKKSFSQLPWHEMTSLMEKNELLNIFFCRFLNFFCWKLIKDFPVACTNSSISHEWKELSAKNELQLKLSRIWSAWD